MQDILPDSLRQQYGIGSWLEDVEEVHRPTSEQQYQRACKGIAMRVRRRLNLCRGLFLEGRFFCSDACITAKPACITAKELVPHAHCYCGLLWPNGLLASNS
jgi:hypothetical protein